MMSADDKDKATTTYQTYCRSCHGEKLQGNTVAPDINNAGTRLTFDEFKNLLQVGKGPMPGFAHIEEQRVTALYRYLGGNPNARAFPGFAGGRREPVMPKGPVVASGGATVPADEKPAPAMADYPKGATHANKDRYTTDYGTNWPDMLGTPWSWVMAYDLNTGKVKWKKPFGEDNSTIEARKRGIAEPGAVSGGAKKGMIVTSTGIVFANGKGGKLYAFDENDGKILWETTLNHETNGQPIMYTLNGKQYLIVNATGNFGRDTPDHSKEPNALPKGFVAYALP